MLPILGTIVAGIAAKIGANLIGSLAKTIVTKAEASAAAAPADGFGTALKASTGAAAAGDTDRAAALAMATQLSTADRAAGLLMTARPATTALAPRAVSDTYRRLDRTHAV